MMPLWKSIMRRKTASSPHVDQAVAAFSTTITSYKAEPSPEPAEAEVRQLAEDAYRAGRWGQPLERWWREHVTSCWYRRLFIRQDIFTRCETAWCKGRQDNET